MESIKKELIEIEQKMAVLEERKAKLSIVIEYMEEPPVGDFVDYPSFLDVQKTNLEIQVLGGNSAHGKHKKQIDTTLVCKGSTTSDWESEDLTASPTTIEKISHSMPSGEQFKILRVKTKLTQKGVANKVEKVSATTISDIESCKKYVTIDRKLELLKFYTDIMKVCL